MLTIVTLHGITGEMLRLQNAVMQFTVPELACAVRKSEGFIRQHIHRKHLTAYKEGRNVTVALEEAVRWAQERGLSFVRRQVFQ